MPEWLLPLTLHTDAIELTAGAGLTQLVEKRGAPLGDASHRMTRGEEKLSPNDREVLTVLDVFSTPEFTLVTDCAALLWLSSSQPLVEHASVGTANDAVIYGTPMAYRC